MLWRIALGICCLPALAWYRMHFAHFPTPRVLAVLVAREDSPRSGSPPRVSRLSWSPASCASMTAFPIPRVLAVLIAQLRQHDQQQLHALAV